MNKRTLLIAIVALVGLCTTNKGHAAATVEEINWSNYAKTVDEVANTETYVYLYNTNAKKFLTSGGVYGMEGIFASVGMRFKIETSDKNGCYRIISRFDNPNQGNCVAIAEDQNQTIYLDRQSKYDNTSGYMSLNRWRFILDASGKAYSIRNNDDFKTTTGGYWDKTYYTYYYWMSYSETNNKLVSSSTDKSSTSGYPTPKTPAAEWIIVTEADYRAEISRLEATFINVSGLIYDTRFDRNNADVNQWTLEENATVNNTWDVYTEEADYGAYNAASIESGTGKLSQTITGLTPGLYRVTCQSFDVTDGTNDCAYLFANNEKSLVNTISTEVFGKGTSITTTNNAIKAGAIFAGNDTYNTGEGNQAYTNEIYVMVGEDGILTFGIDKTCEDGMVFADNFELFYCGTQQMFLDANNTSTASRTVTDGTATGIDYTEYKYPVRLNLRRSFKLNAWNAIVLPVDLSGDQVKAAFGNGDAKLSKLMGINPDRPSQILFQSVDLDKEGMTKGECYIVYVTKGPDLAKDATESYVNKNTENVTIKGPVYHIEGVTQDAYTEATVTKDYTTDAGKLTFTGYYYRPASIDAGLYMMEYGNMYHLTEAYTSLFGTYWTLSYSDGSTSDSKFSLAIDGVDEGTTAIEGINTGRTETAGQDGIYTIGGQRMSQEDMKLLPKGIYIVKGKKIVVR
ncbi:hypothetical protein [Prevotella sp. P3-122]|uniref:hypothetical protein n=1 Tax=Prevotella sp. P3-122 TaxID=2024223 RepID=UPI000B96F1B1|nr:hypothetical protein [Prevotella sp. P3-122]OYP59874.1 hypothetical protein CIL02_10470 [Prevotella sp. P3-122]